MTMKDLCDLWRELIGGISIVKRYYLETEGILEFDWIDSFTKPRFFTSWNVGLQGQLSTMFLGFRMKNTVYPSTQYVPRSKFPAVAIFSCKLIIDYILPHEFITMSVNTLNQRYVSSKKMFLITLLISDVDHWIRIIIVRTATESEAINASSFQTVCGNSFPNQSTLSIQQFSQSPYFCFQFISNDCPFSAIRLLYTVDSFE